MNVGQTYLFIAGPGRATADTAIVIETFDPAWRTATVPHPTLDGQEVPVEPEALLAFLRAKLSGLPATDASAPVPQEPMVRLLLVGAGLAGAATSFVRRRMLA